MPGSKNRSNSCNWAPNGAEFGTARLGKIGEFRGAPIDPRTRVARKLASRILGEAWQPQRPHRHLVLVLSSTSPAFVVGGGVVSLSIHLSLCPSFLSFIFFICYVSVIYSWLVVFYVLFPASVCFLLFF
jgi:hypothetical protein